MIKKPQTVEAQLKRDRLEACADWNDEQERRARRVGDERDARRHQANALSCRLRQR
jgi:hypothetical protein